MRDIRGDLEERANHCQEQIEAAYARFEMMAQQLQREHDTRIAELNSMFAMVHKFIEFENSHMENVETVPSKSERHWTLAERIQAASG